MIGINQALNNKYISWLVELTQNLSLTQDLSSEFSLKKTNPISHSFHTVISKPKAKQLISRYISFQLEMVKINTNLRRRLLRIVGDGGTDAGENRLELLGDGAVDEEVGGEVDHDEEMSH